MGDSDFLYKFIIITLFIIISINNSKTYFSFLDGVANTNYW